MKKTDGKKLTLNTTTIRQLEDSLSPEQLKGVVGGGSAPTDKCHSIATRSCSGTATC
jgi:hypothetical protein